MADENTNIEADPAEVVTIPASELARLKGLESNHRTLEADTAGSFVERDLAAALANNGNLVSNGARDLLKLWKDDFVAKRIDGRWVVEARGGGSVADVVNARLDSPDYTHYIKASGHRGGAGSGGASATPSPRDPFGNRLTPVQQIAANLRAMREQHGGRGIGQGR